MQRFSNKTILVTGGSSGMGKATAQRLTQEGATVVITGRKLARLEDVKPTFEHPDRIVLVEADVSDLAALDKMYEQIEEHVGKLDGIFANAGIRTVASVLESTEADFDKTFNVNVKGVFFTIQKGIRLLNNPSAVAINASILSHIGASNAAIDSATKAAVRSFVQTFTLELGELGIRVNSISPGTIKTEALEKAEISGEDRDALIKDIPVGRLGKPEETAALAAFLLSDDASYIAGEDIVMDGGLIHTTLSLK